MEFISGLQGRFNTGKSVCVICQKPIDLHTTKSKFYCAQIFRNHPECQGTPRQNAHSDKGTCLQRDGLSSLNLVKGGAKTVFWLDSLRRKKEWHVNLCCGWQICFSNRSRLRIPKLFYMYNKAEQINRYLEVILEIIRGFSLTEKEVTKEKKKAGWGAMPEWTPWCWIGVRNISMARLGDSVG